MSLSSCLRKAGNLINKDDRLAIMSTAKNLRASGLDADEAGLQAITRQTEVVRAAIKAITGRDEPVRQLVAKPGADKPRGIGFDTTSASAAARSVSREKFNGNGAQVEIKEVDGGFDALINGERVGRLRDNLPRGAAEQLDESASVDIVKVDNEFKGQGVGSALYDAFNEKHGGRIAPSGKTSPEAWALWKRKFPEKVDAFVEAEAARIADGADQSMVIRNISDPEVARRVAEAAPETVIRSASRQTDAPEFKRWFGDSKVREEMTSSKQKFADMPPRVVYHATNADFSSFESGRPSITSTTFGDLDTARHGIFFAEDVSFAETYLKKGAGQNVIPTYLSIQNPLYLDEGINGEDLSAILKHSDTLTARDFYYVEPHQWWTAFDDEFGAEFVRAAQAAGFDGARMVERNPDDRDDGDLYAVWVAFRPEQIKSAIGNNGAFDPADANITRSLPRAIIAGDLGSLNNDPDYTAAKGGDLDAALRLAGRVVDADLAEQLSEIDSPIVAGVSSIEASGKNAIPQAAAGTIAGRLDADRDSAIVQSSAPKRTALAGLDRIFNRPEFAGDVEAGRNYILVDDTITQGGTFAAMGRHIESGGGRVAAIVALSGKQYSATITVDDATINTLREKFGDVENEFQQATGYRFDGLTQSEARYLASFKPADAVRARIIEEAGQGAGSQDRGASGQEVARSVARPAFYSQLQRAIEQVPDRLATMAAPQWKLWLDANASKLGIKKDEIEWSGVKDYLTLRGKDKVTRDELVAYLSDSGVRVQETVLGKPLVEQKLTSRQELAKRYDEAVDAAMYADASTNPTYIESIAADDRKPEEQALLDAWNAVNENPNEPWTYDQGDPTRYDQYTVPGGENYLEVLITLPPKQSEEQAVRRARRNEALATFPQTPESRAILAETRGETSDPGYKSSHWDQPNILAHLRVDDRVDADGARVLFIGELQSDWGQQAKKDGIRSSYKAEDVELLPADDPESVQPEFFWYFKVPGNVLQIPKSKYTTSAEARDYIVREKLVNPSGVPAAPFISETKAWASLALKRAIMMAVEGGHDKIAIITGQQAADLYDLSKRVDSVLYEKVNDKDLWEIEVRGLDGETIIEEDEVPASRLEELIGKELAQKIVNGDGEKVTPDGARDWRRLSGLDLKVGGEGMRAFYDQIIPQVARDVLKKLGGGQMDMVSIGESNDGKFAILKPDGTFHSGIAGVALFPSRASAQAAANKLNRSQGSGHKPAPAPMQGGEQPGFDITPAMREKVASGVPLFSKGRTTGDYGRAYTAEQQEMFKNTGRTVAPQTLIERVKEARSDMWKKMAQGIVDQFRPIRDLGGDAYTLARLSKGSAGAFEALLNYGKLSIVDGAYDADMSGGFVKTIGEPLGAELEDFAWWVASNRAERLAVEDRENLFTRRDIDAGKSLAQGTLPKPYTKRDGTTTTDRAEAYADSLVKFNEFNKNVLDIAEQSGLIDGDARKIWENEFYVPFYRVSEEDGQFMGAKIKGGLARQRAFQELKGGSQKLNSDLLANTMKNWAHLIDASAKNRAAKATLEAAEKMNVALEADAETVRQLGKNIGGKGGTVWFMDGGQQRHFVVGDPYLLAAINSLEYAGLRGPLMDALSATKHWLTVGVTASPAFKVRNLIRDSLQAISVSDLSYNPIANMKDGVKASARDSQTYVSALASGGLIRFGTMMEGNGPERVRRLVQKGVKPSTILDSEAKIKAFYSKTIEPVVDAYNELGNRGEEINRAALYSQLRKQGKSHAEAALLSRDLMDFSMQGAWASIRFLTQVVPFLNARLQGLYKLGRGASEDPRKFAITTGAVAMVSIALMAAYSDDEDWKKREDWDRDTNWWFKIGGVAFRIPKPFEIGAIGTLAERGVELFVNDEFTLKRFLGRVKHIASDNLAMNPVPQAIKPIIDVYANKDAFSGRPIESMGMERLQSEYRYTASTSMVARGASTALNTISRNTIGEESLSPVQIDSMLRGYFGWLGTFIVGGADMLTRPLTNEPSRPQADYLKVITQGIARQLPEPSSKYVSAVYDQAKILEQAYATHRQLIREGKVDDAREFAEDNADLLRRYRLVERVKGAQSQINRMIREIERGNMDPKKKREEIQKLRDRQSKIAAEVY